MVFSTGRVKKCRFYVCADTSYETPDSPAVPDNFQCNQKEFLNHDNSWQKGILMNNNHQEIFQFSNRAEFLTQTASTFTVLSPYFHRTFAVVRRNWNRQEVPSNSPLP